MAVLVLMYSSRLRSLCCPVETKAHRAGCQAPGRMPKDDSFASDIALVRRCVPTSPQARGPYLARCYALPRMAGAPQRQQRRANRLIFKCPCMIAGQANGWRRVLTLASAQRLQIWLT